MDVQLGRAESWRRGVTGPRRKPKSSESNNRKGKQVWFRVKGPIV